jgi:hypothetical protein
MEKLGVEKQWSLIPFYELLQNFKFLGNHITVNRGLSLDIFQSERMGLV